MYPLPDPRPRRLPIGRLARSPKIGATLASALAAVALGAPMLAEAEPGLAPTAVSAGCRPVDTSAQCLIGVTFNAVEGARYYTATVATPKGNVIPYGQVAGAGTGRLAASLTFPYDGDGPYRVFVRALGVDETGTEHEAASEGTETSVNDAKPKLGGADGQRKKG